MLWLILAAVSLSAPLALGSFPFSSTLAMDPATGNALYQLQWTFDSVQKTITFNVVVKTTGWVGFGLSPDGGMVGSDVVTGWVTSEDKGYLQDRFAFATAPPPIDPSQDWTLLSGSERNGYTNLTFTRKWVTCDSRDRDIQANTAKVVYSWGSADPASATLTSDQYHGPVNRGSVSLNLLGGLLNKPPQPSDAQNFTIAVSKVLIPSQVTTYWCTGFKLPSEVLAQKRYITKISPQISPSSSMNVHHMLIYQCLSLNETTDVGQGYNCDSPTIGISSCRLGRPVLVAWAVGGDDFVYPSGIAFPIGGSSEEQYVMLEMHYNNPSLVTGVTDSSGFLITYTSIPPTYEAGILTLGSGVSPLMIIPPRDASFKTYGTCASQCTSAAIPSTGITIFGNLLHTHLAGRGVTLRHMRMNSSACSGLQELPLIDQNLQYDFNFQQTNILISPVNVLPGDILQVLCTYNTTGRNNVTVGGESTYDEMCLSFAVYYPRIELTSCLSEIDVRSYVNFVLANFDPANIQALNSLLLNSSYVNFYNSIKSTFGSLAWSQKQQNDFQTASANANYYDGCSSRNGSFVYNLDPAVLVTCPYTAPNTCQLQTSSARKTLAKGSLEWTITSTVVIIALVMVGL